MKNWVQPGTLYAVMSRRNSCVVIGSRGDYVDVLWTGQDHPLGLLSHYHYTQIEMWLSMCTIVELRE